jgi:hypothetical protein
VKNEIEALRGSTSTGDRYRVVAFDAWQNQFSDMDIIDFEGGWAKLKARFTGPNGEDAPEEIDFTPYTTDYRKKLNRLLQNSQTDVAKILIELDNMFSFQMESVSRELKLYLMVPSLNPHAWYKQVCRWMVQESKRPNTIYNAYWEEFGDPDDKLCDADRIF